MAVAVGSGVEVRVLWQRFWESRDPWAREELVESYLPLVRSIASHLSAGLPAHVDEDDLVSYGMVGLNAAIERFEPDRGTRFEGFAATRIRGAILDELRALDWVPRSVRSRARDLDAATARLEHELGRPPRAAEVGERLGLDERDVRRSQLDVSQGSVGTLDELWTISVSSGDRVSLLDMIADPNAPDPQALLDTGELKGRLADAIAQLPERERLVVALYYYEGLTLREVGEVLGVTESRVSQVHTKALGAMESTLRHG